ncbi:M23/M37 peptidase [hydrothermal vent metagenome]|uniref:M23/M37 peptidase n=1 Tax=hydrothermal vent metagenome TaxID=652676 RepID=A0A1W1B8F9_9ZZZZ
MKDQLIVTISDIHGSKQYTVHEVIKKIILWILVAFVAIILATYMYINMINDKVSQLNSKVETIQQRSIDLKKLNSSLIRKNHTLKNDINESSEKLSLMNSKLSEIEEMVGVSPDADSTFVERVDDAKIKQQQKIDKAKVTALQKSFLASGIPNGKFLNYRRVSSKFGYRIHPVTKKRDFHSGLDLPAKYGTPIYAPADGVVEYAKKKGAYGNFLLIAHNYGFKTAYGHLSKYAVKYGDYVQKGDIIAYIGSTGRSTGPHLHFEIRYLNKWLDPAIFMKWDTKDIDYISSKEKKVNWSGILKQIQKYINLAK